MFFISLQRVFRSGWTSFVREGGVMAANIFILTMAVSVFTSLFLFRETSQVILERIQEKVDISVYFGYEIPEEDILAIKDELSLIPEVKEVRYVSKDTALEGFIARHEDNPVLMESLDEVGINPFLASLNIKSFTASQYGAIAGFFDNANYEGKIEKIDYYEREPVIDRIFSLTTTVEKAGIILSIVLAIVAALVVFNAIRLAIYNFREEIRIQRLVGASNWFIRGPFLAQGIFSGLFAALLSLILFLLLTWGFDSTIDKLFSDLNIFGLFLANFWIILLIQLGAGIGLGVFSSFIAVKRHLNV